MASFIIVPECGFGRDVDRDSAYFDIRSEDADIARRIEEGCYVFDMARSAFRFTFEDFFRYDTSFDMDDQFDRIGYRIGCECIRDQGARERADRFTIRYESCFACDFDDADEEEGSITEDDAAACPIFREEAIGYFLDDDYEIGYDRRAIGSARLIIRCFDSEDRAIDDAEDIECRLDAFCVYFFICATGRRQDIVFEED